MPKTVTLLAAHGFLTKATKKDSTQIIIESIFFTQSTSWTVLSNKYANRKLNKGYGHTYTPKKEIMGKYI